MNNNQPMSIFKQMDQGMNSVKKDEVNAFVEEWKPNINIVRENIKRENATTPGNPQYKSEQEVTYANLLELDNDSQESSFYDSQCNIRISKPMFAFNDVGKSEAISKDISSQGNNVSKYVHVSKDQYRYDPKNIHLGQSIILKPKFDEPNFGENIASIQANMDHKIIEKRRDEAAQQVAKAKLTGDDVEESEKIVEELDKIIEHKKSHNNFIMHNNNNARRGAVSKMNEGQLDEDEFTNLSKQTYSVRITQANNGMRSDELIFGEELQENNNQHSSKVDSSKVDLINSNDKQEKNNGKNSSFFCCFSKKQNIVYEEANDASISQLSIDDIGFEEQDNNKSNMSQLSINNSDAREDAWDYADLQINKGKSVDKIIHNLSKNAVQYIKKDIMKRDFQR